MKKIAFLTVMLAMVFSCEKSEQENTLKKLNVTKTTREIITADNAFGLSLFREVVTSDKEAKNIFISPTSVALALAMAYNGAQGDTKAAMENVLQKKGFTLQEINESYKSLIDALVTVDPKVLLEVANSIWYRQDFTVLPDFITLNSNYFYATVKAADFNNPATVDAINGWVNEKTHEKITSIIDNIASEAVMYLINAIYFKGIWRSEFDKEKTADGPFTSGEGEMLTIPMMQQQDTFRYFHNEKLACAELPYGQGNYNMIILLPEIGITLQDVIGSLTSESWEAMMNSLTREELVVRLPKFKFDYERTINDELTDMGMGIAFSDMADFTGINSDGGLKISKVLHKTFVEVDEEGTEAAAVTAVIIGTTAYPGEKVPISFVVDHPFVFAIRERDTGAIVFIGCVNDPS
jgi:serine protease inhibitor